MDSCPLGSVIAFDKSLKNYKQLFTFNSNEAFTIYVPAPTTMDFETSVVHRTKTWWSLATLKNVGAADYITGSMEEEEDMDQYSEEGSEGSEDFIGDVPSIVTKQGQIFHCGRLYFQCAGDASFNVTVNFKVALKG